MAQVTILNIVKTVPVSRGAGLRATSTVGKTLPYAMQQQEQEFWCWAAVSVSTRLYYDPLSSLTQCENANDSLSMSGCCATATGGPCDKAWYLDRALSHAGCYRSKTPTDIPWNDLRNEIDDDNPVCARTRWSTNEGHFVAITGYEETRAGQQFVRIDDPFYSRRRMPYDEFRTRYRGDGVWTHTYFVSDPALGGAGRLAPSSSMTSPDELGGAA